MKYINAAEVLPEKLLNEIFNYVDGELLYIPTSSRKRKWGELSGSREYYKKRNSEIINKYKDGETITNIAKRYCLSYDSVRKIVNK
ncbi:MAG: CD3324 family protein [Clostridium celatum]|nr:CD3324 family protein [Clostridium celatum]